MNQSVEALRGQFSRTLSKRIQKIKLKLGKYDELVAELKELEKLRLNLNEMQGAVSDKVLEALPKIEGTSKFDRVDLYDRANDATPVSDKGLEIFGKLPVDFTTDHLTPYLDNDKRKAYQFIAYWKRIQKITTTSFGQYRKVETNGIPAT